MVPHDDNCEMDQLSGGWGPGGASLAGDGPVVGSSELRGGRSEGEVGWPKPADDGGSSGG